MSDGGWIQSVTEGSMPGSPDLSVVIPVHNEEENVEPCHREVRQALDRLGLSGEILFVDDGSNDGTFRVLREIRKRDPMTRVLRFPRNFGQTAAMQAGFDHSRGRVVVTMDGDLQNDPEDIGRLLERIRAGCDFVVGWRRDRKDRLITRKVPSWCANWLIGKITGVRIHDNGCSLKAYRAQALRRTRLYGEMHRFIPAMMSLSGCRHEEIVVNHRPRVAGRSKYGLSRTLRVLSDLLVVKMLIGFTTRPARWFALWSMPFLVLTGAFVALSGYHYAATPPGGAPSIVFPTVAMLFAFAFLQLVLVGMVAELVVWEGGYREIDSVVPASDGEEERP